MDWWVCRWRHVDSSLVILFLQVPENNARIVNVAGTESHEVTNLIILMGADCKFKHCDCRINCMYQYAYLDVQAKTIWSSIQTDPYKLQVEDKLSEVPGDFNYLTTHHANILPLVILDGPSLEKMRLTTNIELKTLPSVVLTSSGTNHDRSVFDCIVAL